MAPVHALSSINGKGKPGVAVKSRNRNSTQSKVASVKMRANNREDGVLYAGSSRKNLMNVEDVLCERQIATIVKSENPEPLDSEDDVSRLMCAKICEDSVFYAGTLTGLKKDNDVMDKEIDIINWTNDNEVKTAEDEDSDATEYSSSYGGTFSGSECELKLEHGDKEVESPFVPSNKDPAPMDDCNMISKYGQHLGPDMQLYRKKKVSAQWRNYIRPLTWRCRWLELRVKEILSQASIYDRELAAYEHEKELQAKIIELDSSVSRSVPFTSRRYWKRAMHGRKRKRNEDKVDVSSYMSNHLVFSYYENKRIDTNCHSVGDDFSDLAEDNMKGNDVNEWLLALKDSDISLPQILLNVEAVQSRVMKLTSHLNNFLSINAIEISSPSNLFLEAPASYAENVSSPPGNNGDENVSSPPGNNGDAMLTGLLTNPSDRMSDYDLEDMDTPDNAASIFGDFADIDLIESTVDLLSDITMDQHGIKEIRRDSEEDVLIDNLVAEVEYQNFEKVTHATERSQEMIKTDSETHSRDVSIAPEVSIPEPSLAGETVDAPTVDAPSQAVLKPCYTGKRRGRKPKRKRPDGLGSVPGPSRTGKRSKRPHSAGPSEIENLQVFVPLRSERLQKRRLLANKKG